MQFLRESGSFSRSVSCTSPLCNLFDTAPQAAKDVSASRDKLIDALNRIERFFHRLDIYIGITPTTAMTDMIVEIMVEVLTILAVATKEVKCGRFSESMSCIFTLPD
jgi:hypothetical protein